MSRYQEEMHTLSGDTARRALKASGLRLRSIVDAAETQQGVNPLLASQVREEASVALLPRATGLTTVDSVEQQHRRLLPARPPSPPRCVTLPPAMMRPVRDYSASPDRVSERMRIRRLAGSLLTSCSPLPPPPPPRRRDASSYRRPPALAPIASRDGASRVETRHSPAFTSLMLRTSSALAAPARAPPPLRARSSLQ
jgi:hypothetical protein